MTTNKREAEYQEWNKREAEYQEWNKREAEYQEWNKREAEYQKWLTPATDPGMEKHVALQQTLPNAQG